MKRADKTPVRVEKNIIRYAGADKPEIEYYIFAAECELQALTCEELVQIRDLINVILEEGGHK